MKIVLDTNCLIAILPQTSPYHRVWQAFENGLLTLCLSTDILEEYNEILLRFYPKHFVDKVINMLINAPNVRRTTFYYRWHLVTADPDDNKFVDCVLNSSANCIVTNDHHFNTLKNIGFPHITIVNIQTFSEFISAG
jgi:putative PIN family toxin of toxin-antitoxin system